MHANEDIWEIGQITVGEGMRVAKEATMGMIVTRGPATMPAMELVATMPATMGPVTNQAMTMIRAATTTGLVTTMTPMGLVATTELVTTMMRLSLQVRMSQNMRKSDIWGRRID
jgi:hypothetical protein